MKWIQTGVEISETGITRQINGINMDLKVVIWILMCYDNCQQMELHGCRKTAEVDAMMTIEQMRSRKTMLGLTNEALAEKSGLPLGTVQKVLAGITKAPRRHTLLKLEMALSETPAGASDSFSYSDEKSSANCVQEPPFAYTAEKRLCTLEDYYALPDERRVELIDGVFYDMASPGRLHQAILGQLYLQLASCADRHPEWELFFAPADVCLDNDNYTMVQPDLYINCSKKDDDKRRLNGAPDYVVEILSPSSRTHDMFRKLSKYRFAGVREYWIVDPEKQKVIVYVFEKDDIPVIYTFHDTVPVGISEGDCSIDFEKIRQKVEKYY